jgi:hypothetical protein
VSPVHFYWISAIPAKVLLGLVTFVTEPKPIEELEGLVYGMAAEEERPRKADAGWYRSRRCWRSPCSG